MNVPSLILALEAAVPPPDVDARIAEFMRLTEEGDPEGFEETLMIKVDGRFKAKRMTNAGAHEAAFGNDNRHREYGFAYIHGWNLVTVDEVLGATELEEIQAEIWHRMRVVPDAIWNGWFGGGRWIKGRN